MEKVHKIPHPEVLGPRDRASKGLASELAAKILMRIDESPTKSVPRKKLLGLMFSEGTYSELNEAFNFLIETSQVRKVHPPGQSHVEILTTQKGDDPTTSQSPETP